MKDGLNPKGWQVHHNLPLDDGGANDVTNLVLIKNDPHHKAVTNEQNSLTRELTPTQSKRINCQCLKKRFTHRNFLNKEGMSRFGSVERIIDLNKENRREILQPR